MRVIIILGILLFAAVAMPIASAKNDDPCRGFWFYDEDFGHAYVYTNGSAGCTGAHVMLPTLRGCNTGGDYVEVERVGNVSFWEYRCGA